MCVCVALTDFRLECPLVISSNGFPSRDNSVEPYQEHTHTDVTALTRTVRASFLNLKFVSCSSSRETAQTTWVGGVGR